MRRLIPVIALLALAAPAQAAPQLPLSHAGRWVTDAQGRVVVLHGHNMVYKRAPYTPETTGFGDDDAAFLAAEGYNNIRVGVIYKGVEPTRGAYDDAYLDSIARTVATLGRHGIVSMLDFHQDLFNEKFQGEGFPDWAVFDDGLPNPALGFPGNYLGNPATQRAFDQFWADHEGIQERFAAAWAHVAARFKDDPNVFGYDLLNEPWPGTTWEQCANPAGCPEFDQRLAAFTQRSLAAIRAVDPDTLVYYEPAVLFNNGAQTNLPDFGDEHLGMSWHDYCLSAETDSSSAACEPFDELVFSNAEDHTEAVGDTSLLTEFGAIDDPNVLVPMVERADRFMVGWQHWHYCPCDDPTTTGEGDVQAIVLDPAKPPEGANVKAEKLALLSRPYPQVVAGTPEAWVFDREAKRFEAQWEIARAGGGRHFGPTATTELAVPRRQYPDGYVTAVEGGRVVSEPGAPTLLVRACADADRVRVVVTPSGEQAQTCVAPPALRARLRVTASPKRVRAGRRVRLRVTVRAARIGGRLRPVRGARVRIAGRRARTKRTGRAVLRVRVRRPGRVVIRARARGYEPGRATIRVRDRR